MVRTQISKGPLVWDPIPTSWPDSCTGLKSGINGVFRKGRKPVLWLSLTGIFVSGLWIAVVLALGQRISIYIILISPVFAVVGGGSTVLVSAIYSVVADVVCEADR